MVSFTALVAFVAAATTVSAHLELTYPGTRGNNLLSSAENVTCDRGTADDYDGGRGCFPYGMQWMYPCGGLGVTTNRTYWPTKGGALAFQPGWFSGHSTAFIYINIGLGEKPLNMSHPMTPVFQIVGPTNDAYQGRPVCIPQLGMPANLSLQAGDKATIQVVEAAKHGAALYTCVDIELTDNMTLVEEVTPENCYNDTSIKFNMIFTTLSLTAAAPSSYGTPAFYSVFSIAVAAAVTLLSL